MKKRYLSLAPFILWSNIKKLPFCWEEIFQCQGPLEVEIGFGNGEFLVRQALTFPEKNFVGLEVAWGSIRRALRVINQSKVKNVRLLQADSRMALAWFFASQSITKVYSLFPMPWPKKHHEKHRLFSHNFLKLLNNRLQMGGEVQIVTDYEPYFQWVKEQIPGTGFSVETQITFPKFNTKYERKWQEKGQNKFFEINLIKQNHIEVSLKSEVALKTYNIDHFDPEKFSPQNERGEVVVQFQEFIFDPKQQKGMVRVTVVEDHLLQHFWIAIEREDDGWHIKVAPGCAVLSTVGVQRALDLVYLSTLTNIS